MTKKCPECGGAMYSAGIGHSFECEVCGYYIPPTKKQVQTRKAVREIYNVIDRK